MATIWKFLHSLYPIYVRIISKTLQNPLEKKVVLNKHRLMIDIIRPRVNKRRAQCLRNTRNSQTVLALSRKLSIRCLFWERGPIRPVR